MIDNRTNLNIYKKLLFFRSFDRLITYKLAILAIS